MNSTAEKYRPLAKLGHGGMASVLLTVMSGPADIHKLLVVKKLLPQLAKDAEFVAMFMNEARVAARLNHPNVLSTYEVGTSDEGPFIVMEYLEGQSLSAVLRRVGRGAMPLSHHVNVLRRLLAGLEYAHNLVDFDGRPLALVHRDVSPQNSFVGYDGGVKLVDFGIAKVAGLHGQHSRSGRMKGKLGYMAPEQILGEKIDRRADVFSVGVMLWEALAHRRMTLNESDVEVLSRRRRGDLPKVHAYAPQAPAELVSICERALAFSPDDRYPTAAALGTAIDEWVHHAGLRLNDADVGNLVTEAFAVERARIKSLIEEQLSTGLSGSIEVMLPDIERLMPAETGAMTGMEGEGGTPSEVSELAGGGTSEGIENSVRRSLAVPSGKRHPPRWALVAGAGALLAASLVLGLLTRGSPAAAPLPAVSAAPVLPVPREPPAPPVAASVHFAVRVIPEEARLTLDGQPLGKSPYTSVVPRDHAAHIVKAALPGYVTVERALTFDADADLALELEPETKVSIPSGGARKGLRDKAHDPAFDVELKKDSRPRRNVDEKNPY